MIKIDQKMAQHLGKTNCELFSPSFEDLIKNQTYDVVAFFASQQTFDKNTKYGFKEIIERCHALLNDKGTLLLEALPVGFELLSAVEDIIKEIGNLFKIKFYEQLDYGSFMDKNRTYGALQRNLPLINRLRLV